MEEIAQALETNREQVVAELLDQARMLSTMMREHQSAVVRLNNQRRKKILQLRELGVPYRLIAEECGITDQAVFADLRKHRQV